MTINYKTEEERKAHFSAIQALASQYNYDESTIREIYERKLEILMASARVETYLSVLVVRQVKDVLLNHH